MWTPSQLLRVISLRKVQRLTGKMVTTAVTEHWQPCSVREDVQITFGSKWTGGRKKTNPQQASTVWQEFCDVRYTHDAFLSYQPLPGSSLFSGTKLGTQRGEVSHPRAHSGPWEAGIGPQAWLILTPLVLLYKWKEENWPTERLPTLPVHLLHFPLTLQATRGVW